MSKKHYTKDFKIEVVKEYMKGNTYQAISDKFDISKSSIGKWVEKYSEECQDTPSKRKGKPSKDYAKEIREKNQRIAELEKENAFLKKAAAFFAQQTD